MNPIHLTFIDFRSFFLSIVLLPVFCTLLIRAEVELWWISLLNIYKLLYNQTWASKWFCRLLFNVKKLSLTDTFRRVLIIKTALCDWTDEIWKGWFAEINVFMVSHDSTNKCSQFFISHFSNGVWLYSLKNARSVNLVHWEISCVLKYCSTCWPYIQQSLFL